MASFFEKLKKGMGIENTEEEVVVEEIEEKPKKMVRVKKPPKESKLPTGQAKKVEMEAEPIETETEKVEGPEIEEKPSQIKVKEEKEKWFGSSVGQLAVDVYQTDDELVIQSTIAGVKPEDLDISIEGDVIAIRGAREKPAQDSEINYFYQECYWGPFSREIILPCEVDPSRVEATMKEGVLTVRIPKIEREKKRKIMVKG